MKLCTQGQLLSDTPATLIAFRRWKQVFSSPLFLYSDFLRASSWAVELFRRPPANWDVWGDGKLVHRWSRKSHREGKTKERKRSDKWSRFVAAEQTAAPAQCDTSATSNWVLTAAASYQCCFFFSHRLLQRQVRRATAVWNVALAVQRAAGKRERKKEEEMSSPLCGQDRQHAFPGDTLAPLLSQECGQQASAALWNEYKLTGGPLSQPRGGGGGGTLWLLPTELGRPRLTNAALHEALPRLPRLAGMSKTRYPQRGDFHKRPYLSFSKKKRRMYIHEGTLYFVPLSGEASQTHTVSLCCAGLAPLELNGK